MAGARIWLRFWAIAVALASCIPAPASAKVTDADVEAAFLPRFARYVTWPAAAAPKGSDAFVLCVFGNRPFAAAVQAAAHAQTADGRRIIVRNLLSPARDDGCHIAFVDGGNPQSTGQMLAAIGKRPVLTVTDDVGGPRGIIHFTVVGGRVRFFIDQEAAGSRGLTISSRLLALAVGVRK